MAVTTLPVPATAQPVACCAPLTRKPPGADDATTLARTFTALVPATMDAVAAVLTDGHR